MARVGIKNLKDHLSAYLRRVRKGERVLITDRGKTVAALSRVDEAAERDWVWAMVEEGLASWSGGKPVGCPRPPKPRGRSASAVVLEDRR